MSQQSPLPPAPAPSPQQAAPAAFQPASVAGERHVSSVAGQGGSFSKKQGAIMVICAAGALVAFVLLRPQGAPVDRNQTPEDRLRVGAVSRYEPPPLPAMTPTPAAFPISRPQFSPPVIPTRESPMPNLGVRAPEDPLAKARRAPLLSFGSNGTGNGGAQQGGQEEGGGPYRPGAASPNELAARLQATPVNAVGATVLPHQPYLLTKGNTVPCVLQTAMDSTLPGFVTCKLPNDVIGKTGITLLDRGTLVVGETHGGMQQGQNRLFVLWTRAETPAGVVINLDSPAADPLGRAGFDGEVETHFWSRLGGALLLSIVQGGLQAGVAAASPQGSTNINTGAIDSVAAESLRNSVNIRPTLKKNHGELVSIFVARDLDFSTVYQVRTVPVSLTGSAR